MLAHTLESVVLIPKIGVTEEVDVVLAQDPPIASLPFAWEVCVNPTPVMLNVVLLWKALHAANTIDFAVETVCVQLIDPELVLSLALSVKVPTGPLNSAAPRHWKLNPLPLAVMLSDPLLEGTPV